MCEVTPWSPHFPDSLVRLAPYFLQVLHQGGQQSPGFQRRGRAAAAPDVERAHDFSVHVELKLLVGRVSDTHGGALLVAGKPGQLELGNPAFAPDTVEDL